MFTLPPLASETIFNIGSLPITNTYINSTLAVVLFVIAGFIMRKRGSEIPDKIQNFAESILEVVLGYIDQVTHDRKKALKFLPLVGSLFLFILISNWIGIFPGIGSVGRFLPRGEELEFIPLFRPANTDLNMTLAMAVISIVLTHIFGVIAVGFWRYANKFVKLGDIIKSLSQGGISIFVAMVEFGVGIIEIFSEVAKIVSLSLRLFGNIFAGEVLLTVIAALASFTAYFIPLPFLMLEILVGLIQAIVFSMLVLVSFTMATAEIHEGH
jgi:F-type H+-transporting ATPase subunit a